MGRLAHTLPGREVIGVYYGKRQLILTWIAAVLAGTALHFLYSWQPNAVTALFSPICESLWEHSKIVFWPYLLAALWLNWERPGGIRPWLLALPLMVAGMLVLGFGYHVLAGGGALWVDIVLYLAVMAFGFWLPGRFSGPFNGVRWAIPVALTVLLGLLLGLFTLWPPEHVLFADLSVAGAWLPLPC